MNILHISPYYPDTEANHAGGVCMGKEIETLASFNNVYVLTFISQPFDEGLAKRHAGDEHWQAVRISRWTRAFHALANPWMPNYFAARSSLRFSLKLIQMVKKYHIDAIHAEYASMGQYMWIRKMFPCLSFNLVEHDMTAQSFERKLKEAERKSGIYIGSKKQCSEDFSEAANGGDLRISHVKVFKKLKAAIKVKYIRNQYNKIRKCEKKYCLGADTLFTFNEKDKGLIRDFYGRCNTAVLNPYCGIDDSVFEAPIDDSIREAYSICFLGQMGRSENDRAARRLIDICISIKQKLPELKVYIVGSKPSEELKRAAEDANKIISAGNLTTRISEDNSSADNKARPVHDAECKDGSLTKESEMMELKKWINVTGFVEDVDIYLKKAQAAVFPLDMGAGIKVKVLRSMALGTPVITGEVGAEGIDEGGTVIIHAETDEEYAEQIIGFFDMSNSEREKLCKRSQDYIREHFCWKKSEEILRLKY